MMEMDVSVILGKTDSNLITKIKTSLYKREVFSKHLLKKINYFAPKLWL